MTLGEQFAVVSLVVLLSLSLSEEADVSLTGSSYIQYNMHTTKTKVFDTSETLSLRFKTINPTGLLFYAHGSTGQFVSLELVHGKLRYTLKLVTVGSNQEPYSQTFGDKLGDNNWHSVRITRDRQRLRLHLDNHSTKNVDIQLPRHQTRYHLLIDSGYYVGGTWKSTNEYRKKLVKNFVGCLSDVLFNAIHPISEAKLKKTGYEIKGKVVYKCPASKFEPISFTSNMAVLKIPTVAKHRVSVSFAFRTYDRDGILLYRDGPKASVYLYLKNGKLSFDFQVGVKEPFTLDTCTFVRGDLNDGEWHRVMASVDPRSMAIQVDHYLGVNTSAYFDVELDRSTSLDFENVTYIAGGTYYRDMHGFVGCMQDLRVNGETIDLKYLKKPAGIVPNNFVVRGQCTLKSFCHPSACRYRSQCIQALNNYTCQCRRFYSGRNCEVPLFQPTCQRYKELGMQQDAYCIVDPDNVGPLPEFRVLCNMTADKDAVSIVNHTLGDRPLKVRDATHRLSRQKRFLYLFKYGASYKNLRALVDESDHCRQYVQFDCIDTKFFERQPDGSEGAAWFSTDNQFKFYWGAAKATSSSCACAETNSCHDRSKSCNCDTGDNVWRRDAGYITEKADLPIVGIYFPETAKESNFTLGPLECFGRKQQLTRDTSERKYFDIACQPLVSTPPPVYPWMTARQTTTKKFSNQSSTAKPSTTNRSSVARSPENSTVEESKTAVIDQVGKNTSQSNGTVIHRSVTKTVSPTDRIRVNIKSLKKEKSWVLIVILAGSAVLLVLLSAFLFVIVRHKRANGVWCTGLFRFSSCGKHQQLPKIEIYRHSMGTDSPDILHMGDFKNSKVIDLYVHNGRFVARKDAPKMKKTVTFKDDCC